MQETPTPSAARPDFDDIEIDLRPYLMPLLRWWREELLIIGVIVFVVVGAAYLNRMFSRTYSSSAQVVIVRTTSDVSFDARFTVQNDPLSVEGVPSNDTQNARRNALLGMAQSPSIGAEVIEQLGDLFEENQPDPVSLARAMTVEFGTEGSRQTSDLLVITATTDDPVKSAAVANAWAEVFVRTANGVYGQVPDGIIASLQEEQQLAQVEYDRTQRALETFIAQDTSSRIQRQIGETDVLIAQLRRTSTDTLIRLVDQSIDARTQLFQAYLGEQISNARVAYEKEQASRRARFSAYLSALYNSEAAIFDEQAKRKLQDYETAYSRLTRHETFLNNAQVLRNQIVSADTNTLISSGLTVQIFNLRALAGEVPALEFPAGGAQPVNRTALLSEVDSLISSLEQSIEETTALIDELSDELLSGEGYTNLGATVDLNGPLAVAALELRDELSAPPSALGLQAPQGELRMPDFPLIAELDDLIKRLGEETASELPFVIAEAEGEPSDISAEALALREFIAGMENDARQLRAQLELERSRGERLTNERNLAREALNSVNNKLTELRLARAAGSSEVRLATTGVTPERPNGRSLLLPLLASGMLGVMLAVGTALVLDFQGYKPFVLDKYRERFGRKKTPSAEGVETVASADKREEPPEAETRPSD
ncbi:hypothetical protein [Candidatus Chloroploca asiatica]|uniref:Polysaccharide chain length determinant N-terminal domain-containing protein n=1 Tax=Candidatus Chloroploca asiatica TaxID=1506545 RepID=A0A2H3L9I2_9CHLR|nr:hypothetical protein [Candidatus Chloroploca asiatica]PDV99991.1 hypothetical protein A9Q02_11195 [Candidatus Chloroploca asiatica]